MEDKSSTSGSDQTSLRGSLSVMRALFARTDDPYAGADVALARRVSMAIWGFSTLVVAVLEVFYPPTHALGNYGWLAAAAEYAVAIGIVLVLADKRRTISFDFLYITMFLGVGAVAVIQHGAGGRIAPYHELYMFLVVGTAVMHPPRRVLGFLVVVAAAMFLPIVYAPSTAYAGEIITQLLLWTALALVLMTLMRTIRAQRIELRQEGHDARQLARVDPLTGLGNRRAFDEALDAELARSRRSGAPLSLIMADLNDFKEINDAFGHVAGDDCLRQATAALRAAVRRPDLCFRWGGDEFAILLTGAHATVGRALSLRLEATVSASCQRPDGEPLTLTCGHAMLDAEMSAADAVARSDATLLALKARGEGVGSVAAPAPA